MDIHVHICYILVTLWIFNTQERNRYERKTIKKRKDFEGFLIFFFLDVVAEISKRENTVLAILLNTKKEPKKLCKIWFLFREMIIDSSMGECILKIKADQISSTSGTLPSFYSTPSNSSMFEPIKKLLIMAYFI